MFPYTRFPPLSSRQVECKREKPVISRTTTLDINTTVSTWLELIELMSEGDFWHHLYVGTYQWVFGCFPRNRRSREHINRYRAGFFAKARVEIKIIICQPFCMFKLYASNSFLLQYTIYVTNYL